MSDSSSWRARFAKLGETAERRRRAILGSKWEFLAEAGALMDSSLDYETTLANVVELSVPTVADYCAIGLMDEQGVVNWGSSAHRDPAKAELAVKLRAYSPNLGGMNHPGAKAILSGEAQLINSVDEAFLRVLAVDDTHLALIREVGPTAYLGVPLLARGRVLGLLVFVATAESGRRYTESDVLFATEIGKRAALAVDHAVLYRAAEEAGRAREAMVSVVSHDLKNPLSTIQMAVSFLLEDIVPDDESHAMERRQLSAVKRESARMYRLIHDLLDMNAIDAGKLLVQRSPQEVAPLVEEVIDTLRPLALAKTIELALEAPALIPPVHADRDRIFQVFSNLGGNAIKFTPEGGRVVIRVRHGESVVAFDVVDTGPGIPPEDVARVFDRYWQAKKTASLGSGLGLTIAKGIVEAHGGRIEVTSAAGEGSVFSFTIPVSTETATTA
ncbi:MAG TPA: GAF domain-containing sensor histidine kinase [Gemmatimonadaceae bacterium]|nr:GAF domain-containing sensor histidine kinase [Gemmatimonadaceae bacterium]